MECIKRLVDVIVFLIKRDDFLIRDNILFLQRYETIGPFYPTQWAFQFHLKDGMLLYGDDKFPLPKEAVEKIKSAIICKSIQDNEELYHNLYKDIIRRMSPKDIISI